MSKCKLVPVEPTPEMERAAESYWGERRFRGLSDDPRAWAGVYRAMIDAAPDHIAGVSNMVAGAAQGEPVAWYLPSEEGYDSQFRDHATVKSCSDNPWEGWQPLYTAPQPTEQQPAPDVTQLVDALESLIKGYVGLLEAGKDRITSLGGDCDPVPVMEKNDPWLRGARAALAAYRNQEGDV